VLEFGGSGQSLRRVAAIDGAAEAAVGGALRGHERTFYHAQPEPGERTCDAGRYSERMISSASSRL
jgi:hypothetical protein